MELNSLTLTRTIPVTQLLTSVYRTGKVTLPMTRGAAYASFKNVKGVPSQDDGNGFSIFRLKAMDALVERLRGSNNKLAENMPGPGNRSDASFMMNTLQKIHEAFTAKPRALQEFIL
ncbi:MAG: hypothetical protein E4H36_00315 [Spirochaetales bacterium]|nr:MAG: hypothetical protein E4H36_00315 [Spirochaetales bacterium]